MRLLLVSDRSRSRLVRNFPNQPVHAARLTRRCGEGEITIWRLTENPHTPTAAREALDFRPRRIDGGRRGYDQRHGNTGLTAHPGGNLRAKSRSGGGLPKTSCHLQEGLAFKGQRPFNRNHPKTRPSGFCGDHRCELSGTPRCGSAKWMFPESFSTPSHVTTSHKFCEACSNFAKTGARGRSSLNCWNPTWRRASTSAPDVLA